MRDPAAVAGDRSAAQRDAVGMASADTPCRAAIEGQVVSGDNEPVAGALISASGWFHPQIPGAGHEIFSDAQGHFLFERLPPGRYGVTATSASGTAAYGGAVVVPPPTGSSNSVVLRLTGPGEIFQGTVLDDLGLPVAGARVLAAALSENDLETYVAHTDGQGRYLLALPSDQRYMLAADAGPRPRASRQVGPASESVDFRLDPLPAPRPSDERIQTWLQERATPLTDQPELDAAGAAAVSAIVGDAQLVALGESTHGSGEFTDWRLRVFQSLVRDRGFRVYAAEVPWAEALAVNDYVVQGTGSAREALAALLTWTVDTEETLRVVEWMRAYNADSSHHEKLRFCGFDVLTPRAVALLLAYLREVDGLAASTFAPALAPFATVTSEKSYASLPTRDQDALKRQLGAVVAHLDANRARYSARTDDTTWARARQCARLIQQATASYTDYQARDQFMFENIQWLVKHSPAGTKFLLAAHNSHIAAEQHDVQYMGRLLREHWGQRYVAIGTSFREGALQALDWTGGDPNSRRMFEVGSAPAGTLDHDLSLARLPRLLIDLRRAPAPIAAWLQSAQRMRSIGAGFSRDDDFELFTPSRAFDAILYLERVTAAHPLRARP